QEAVCDKPLHNSRANNKKPSCTNLSHSRALVSLPWRTRHEFVNRGDHKSQKNHLSTSVSLEFKVPSLWLASSELESVIVQAARDGPIVTNRYHPHDLRGLCGFFYSWMTRWNSKRSMPAIRSCNGMSPGMLATP